MRQIDFATLLSAEIGITTGEALVYLQKTCSLIQDCLVAGESVHIDLGTFIPLMFTKDASIRWEEGPGPLAHVTNRNRDHVVPIFEWKNGARQFVTRYGPIEGVVADKIRKSSLARSHKLNRSKAYKKVVYAKLK